MSDTLNNQGTQYELDGSIKLSKSDGEPAPVPNVSTDTDTTGDDKSVSDDSQDETTGSEEAQDEATDVEDGVKPSLEAVELLSASLEWLRDVNYSIKRHGVSRADMQALAKVRQNLLQHGVELPSTPSLENYAMATYLEERSGVNVSVATEAFAATMIQTIKRWLVKLIEYVGAMVRWVAKEFMAEEAVKRKLVNKHKQIQALQDLRRKLFTLDKPPESLAIEMVNQASLLLEDENLRNNRMTIAAFNDIKEDKAINETVKQGTVITLRIVKEIDNLKKDLESNTTSPTFDDRPLTELGLVVMALDEFIKDQANEQYVRQNLENTVFTDPVLPHVLVVTPFTDIVQSYRKVHSDLKQIRKIDHQQNVDLIVTQLNELMRAIGNIGQLASGVKQYNNHKLQALRQRAAYDTIYINRFYQSAKTTADEATMATIKRTIESARSKIGSST